MAATTSPPATTRPKVGNTKSFSRFQGSSSPSTSIDTTLANRTRASSHSGSSPLTPQTTLSPAVEPSSTGEDGESVFATKELVTSPTSMKAQESFDELPIEIRSLTERFLKDLTAPVHPQPITADSLSDLFQDFYTKAESQIAASIAVLSLKIGKRTPSPSASIASRTSVSKNSNGTSTPVRKSTGEQQMLTASEVTDRKKARRLLELKRTAWEEIVERTVTEKVYRKIYRHKSADDEERDQKLRSRIAALSLVGIGLKELLSGTNEISDDVVQKSVEEQDHIKDLLEGARRNIQDMDAEHSPQGKLHHLTAAHKSIVETLSQLFPSTSSADEILPTLIYALMTSEPASVNVVSNLKFIQRFRAASKVDGEAAYCLVNLEAATSFLENVDLASLRASEALDGDRSTDRPSTSRTKSAPMNLGVEPASDPATSGSSSPTRPPASPTTKQSRRLSNLISNGTNRFSEAGDSFRGAVLDSADAAFDTIHNTLNGSFDLLFGRLRAAQAQSGNDAISQAVLPKTLEDARKLVSTPPPLEDGDVDAISILTSSTGPEGEESTPPTTVRLTPNERVAELFGGKRQAREHSVDSLHSTGSAGKRVVFEHPATAAAASVSGNAAIDGIRNFGSTINPLTQISRMGGLFARSGSVGTPTVSPVPSSATLLTLASVHEKASPTLLPSQTQTHSRSRSSSILVGDDKDEGKEKGKGGNAVRELRKMAPPSKRFIECRDVRELRLGEVEELLREYQRLVREVGKVVASV